MAYYTLIGDSNFLEVGSNFLLRIDGDVTPGTWPALKWWDGDSWRLVYEIKTKDTSYRVRLLRYWNGSKWLYASVI